MAKKTKSKMAKRVKIVKQEKKSQELTRLGAALRGLGGLGGSALGGMIGMPTSGASAGRSLGATLSKWLGSGDYTVGSNCLVAKARSGTIPAMHNSGQSVVVRHKEYLGDVFSGTGTPTAFSINNSYALNPGLAASFPWLASVAANYQEYTWKGIVYHYVSTSGNATGANTSLGTVAMATNYRSTAPAYTSRLTMLNEYFATDAKPSEDFVHPIECDPKENPFNVQYVRSAAVPAGEDPKTYDLGVTTIATQGMQTAGENLGELWVSYEVELRKPIALGITAPLASYAIGSGTTAIVAASTPYGTNWAASSGTAITSATGKVLTFARGLQGSFALVITMPMSGLTATGGWAFSVVNCSVPLVVEPGASTITSGTGFCVWFYVVTIPDGTQIATLTANASPFVGTSNNCSIYFAQTNASF
jgi:hypothetical protein